MQRTLKKVLWASKHAVSSEPDGEASASPLSVLCAVSHRMWEPSNHIALSSCHTCPHSPFTQDVFIALSATSEFPKLPISTTWDHLSLQSQCPSSWEQKSHLTPILRLTEFSGSKQVLFLLEEERKQNKTQNLLYDSRSVFLLPNPPEAMTPLGHGLLILINLTSFFDQHCFSILASLTASSPPAPTMKPSAKQGLCTHTWVTHEWEFQERVERVP